MNCTAHLSRFAALNDDIDLDRYSIDSHLRSLLAPLLSSLSSGHIGVVEEGSEFSAILSSVLSSISNVPAQRRGPHHPRSIDKLLTTVTQKKNQDRCHFKSDPSHFLNAVRAHNRVLKAARNHLTIALRLSKRDPFVKIHGSLLNLCVVLIPT